MKAPGLNVKNFYEGVLGTYGDEVVREGALESGVAGRFAYLVSESGLPLFLDYFSSEFSDSFPIGVFSGHFLTSYPAVSRKWLSLERRLTIAQRPGRFEQSFDILELIERNDATFYVKPLTESRMSDLMVEFSLGSYILPYETGFSLYRASKEETPDETTEQISLHGREIIQKRRYLKQIDQAFLERCISSVNS